MILLLRHVYGPYRSIFRAVNGGKNQLAFISWYISICPKKAKKRPFKAVSLFMPCLYMLKQNTANTA